MMFTKQLVDSAVPVLYEYCKSNEFCKGCKFLYRLDADTTRCMLYSLIVYRKEIENAKR